MKKAAVAVLLTGCLGLLAAAGTARPARPRPTPLPTRAPTPVPPPRVEESRKGARTIQPLARFASRDMSFSRLLRVEEIDLDRDGDTDYLVEGIGTIRRLPDDVPTVGFVSRSRLPFESPLLAVVRRNKEEWQPLWIAHVPLRCGQSDDLNSCDQVLAFRSVRFRFDDRPQVVLQILHPGDSGLNETFAYRVNRGRLETTFAVSQPRSGVEVTFDPNGIQRRIAVDTFVNKDLPGRYRSFTLKTFYVFGDARFRVYSETIEEPWTERGDVDLAYWGLVHQSGFAAELERLRERHRREPLEAADPVEVVRKKFPDAQRPRVAARQPGVAILYFDRPGGCHAHAIAYQPLRESDGEKSPWEIAQIRGQRDVPYECLDEPPMTR
jgi:hypothetical protein